MKVVSPAGEFEFKVKGSSVEGEHVVMTGQMGVWDSKIYLTPADIWLFTSIFLRPSVILFILKLPFKFLLGSKQPPANQDTEDSSDKNGKDRE
ncbi:MAG: hypothetical protein MI861_04225 [Pirellulales bacterium]|nr:hypothetical protein [Pirellulales bacterium]